MITISLDDPGVKEQALKLLKANHAALPKMTETSIKEEGRTTNNYHWTGDPDDLADLVDPEWSGALPLSLLIAPGGKVIYRKHDSIDAAELKKAIADLLGRTYASR